MAVYSNLLLSAGGGILADIQKAEQVRNTSSILIGLGGTGVHAIRTIKTQVYSRLKPDNEQEAIPEYSHICFLGVDSTRSSMEECIGYHKRMPLEEKEFFYIGNKPVVATFSNRDAMNLKTELTWLEYENIGCGLFGNESIYGIRQIGRYMLMNKSQEFLAQLETIINAAKQGFTSPSVNIHIFAGLSGCIGSGTFLDVCYMVRSVLAKNGGGNVMGYFFLPDVNLSAVPVSVTGVHQYIPKNGYAAMQELEHCMNIQFNGGSFTQEYSGGKRIHWDKAPVDMCHLISSTNADGDVIPNAYDYAMNVTAEYVMDFLVYSKSAFQLTDHLAKFNSMVAQANHKKKFGSNMAYCVLGASCATVPFREMNTYLASELFEKFAVIQNKFPTRNEVEQLAISAMSNGSAKTVDEIYDSLYREIRMGASGQYTAAPVDYKEALEVLGIFKPHYEAENSTQIGKVVSNASHMLSEENEKSLLNKIRTGLTDIIKDIIKDIQRGPMYAYRMLAASESHNLLNIIDGLLAENKNRWEFEAAQVARRHSDVAQSEKDFMNRKKRNLLDNDKKRFADYEQFYILLMSHELSIKVYEQLDEVLRKFRKQIEQVTAGYYLKLNRVMETLMNTFKENYDALSRAESEDSVLGASGFEKPMMKISELKPTLDEEIAKINIPGMLNSFMNLLLSNEEKWLSEDENKITAMVRKFFVETAFAGFANNTITNFLKNKYENNEQTNLTNDELSDRIYRDWILPLTGWARPLFFFDRSVWTEADTIARAVFSIPQGADTIKNATKKLTGDTWRIQESAYTDRIYAMYCIVGLPIGSYGNCRLYERLYFNTVEPGIHLYVGKNVTGMKFNNWNKLPSIIPQSRVDLVTSPIMVKNTIERALALYNKALQFKVINTDDSDFFRDRSYIYKPSEKYIDKIEEQCRLCREKLKNVNNNEQVLEIKTLVEQLVNDVKILPMIRTPWHLPDDGCRETQELMESIDKDYFVSYPVFQQLVEESVEKIESLHEEINQLAEMIQIP